MLRRETILVTLVAAALCAAQQQPNVTAQQPNVTAQQPNAAAPEQSTPVIRAETRLVLVDTVVTDKKGNYVPDLAMKDFRVWEDNKEQEIKSFSFEADPASTTKDRPHYLILFFDNSSVGYNDQAYARKAALQFIDANAGPNRFMAVAEFTGSLNITQNFTADAARLKQVVNGVKFSSVSPNAEVASIGTPSLGREEADFGARDVLLALRTLAKNLRTIPGRKTLVFLSAGFKLDLELRPELTAVIDACNKANVAVYPIDVRGLNAGLQPKPFEDSQKLHQVLAS
jgi:VWFA-related protein